MGSNYHQCYACRRPLSKKDLLNDDYIKGISCHKCIVEKSDKDRVRYAERQKQFNKDSFMSIFNFITQKPKLSLIAIAFIVNYCIDGV